MAKRPRVDPVTQYATDVRDGRIVTGRLVRLACRRHLEDLAHQAEKSLEWDAAMAVEAVEFFRDVLCLPEETDADDEAELEEGKQPEQGTPFVLQPWQQFIVGSLMGWYAYRVNKRGERRKVRRFRVAFLEVAKGAGKTPLAAGLLLYMLVADGERGAQMFCAAVTKDQAKLAFADCEKMVAASPHLKALLDQKVNNLAWLETGSFIRPISAEKRALDGKRVHAAIIDEEHEHPSAVVYLKMRAGTKGRKNAIILIPTNSGFDLESVCWKHHDYSRQVLQGTIQNEAWFAYICHLDACARCAEGGKIQPADECPDCDDWKTEGPHWLKANPNLGVSIPWQYLREQVREAVDIPTQRNMVRRLNFCQWTEQATVGIPPEKWAACKGAISSASLVGRDCILGIDLSDKIDLSSVVAIFPRPMPKDGGVELEDRDATRTVDWTSDVLAFFWMPRNTLHRRAQEDNIPYPDWVKAGAIFETAGDLVDHDQIVDYVITVLAKKYRIRRIGFDQAGATAMVTRLRRHFGTVKTRDGEQDVVIEIPQSFRALSGPTKLVQALAIAGLLQHDGNPCLAWNIANMGFEENAWRELRPVKIDQRKRIDGGVALIDAHAALLQTPMLPKRRIGAFIA